MSGPRRRVVVASLQPSYLPASVVHLPLLWGYLRAYVEQADDLASAYSFAPPLWRIQDLETMLERVGAADVLALSCYVWNQRNSHRLAREVKKRRPGCLIVYGGPNVPNRPSGFLADHPWIDACVHGEGERPFAALLRERLQADPRLERVPGISLLRAGEQVFTAPSPRLDRLDFPSPIERGFFDPVLEEIREEHPHAAIIAGLETTRGCPFSCTFCDWGMATTSRVRRFPRERIFRELDWVSRQEVRVVWMHNANFGLFPHDVEIARYVAKLKEETGFPEVFYPLGFAKTNKDRTFEITKLIADHALDPHTDSVNFSLQTMGQGALEAVGRTNISLEDYRELGDRYADEGYQLHPDLILPLPGETLASFQEGYADLCSWEHVARIQVYSCALLPNSPMADPDYQRDWQIRTRPSALGVPCDPSAAIETEYIDAVVSTRTMSEAEHVEAKVFVALVRALELHRLLRSTRLFVERRTGLPVWRFYVALARWQEEHQGLLAPTLARIREAVAANLTRDELVWPWMVSARDGSYVYYHKAIALDVVSEGERFVHELRRLLVDRLGITGDEALDELLRYQADQWVVPTFDPEDSAGYRFEYQHDWIAFLEGQEPLRRRAVRVTYAPPAMWLEHGYRRSAEAWRRLVLVEHMAYDDHCCFGPRGRLVERLEEEDEVAVRPG